MGLTALSSRGLLPANLTLFSCLLQLPISLSMDLLLTPGEHVLRRDVANGTVQADIVVMLHVPPQDGDLLFPRVEVNPWSETRS